MRFVKPILIGAALAVTGLYAFASFATVTEDDIHVFHNVNHDTDTLIFQPGDIVALNKSGNLTFICDFKVPHVKYGPIENAIYYNQLAHQMPAFVSFVDAIKALFGFGGVPDPESPSVQQAVYDGLEFTSMNGVLTDLDSMPTEFEQQEECERRMAMHLAEGVKACTITKVLNEVSMSDDGSIVRQTTAVAFKPYSNFVGPEKLKEFQIQNPEAVAAANGKKCDDYTYHWSTYVKKKLNVIQRVPVDL